MKSRLLNFFYLFDIRKNILSRLFVALILVAITAIFTIILIWNSSIHTAIHSLSISHVTDIVKNSNKKFEDDLNDIIMNLKTTAQNYTLREYLSNPSDETAEEVSSYLKYTYQLLSNDLKGITLITQHDSFTAGMSYLTGNIYNTEWYKAIEKSNGAPVLINRDSSNNKSLNNYGIGILIKSNGINSAVLVFDFTSQFLTRNFSTSNMNGILNTMIIDEDEKIIFSTSHTVDSDYIKILNAAAKNQKRANTFSTIKLSGEDYLITSKKFASSPKWTNITYFPKSSLYKNYSEAISLTLWCMILVIILMILIAYAISTRISIKFQKLIMYIDNIDFNNLSSHPNLPTDAMDEIDTVTDKLSQMVSTISRQVSTISELE